VSCLLAAACLAAVCIFAGCGSAVTRENFDAVTIGMTMGQVEDLLGAGEDDTTTGGFDISSPGLISGADGPRERTYVWKDGSSQIIVVFADGKVVQKRQVGL
jgi:uncharacterized protein YfaP (DUF2135 family)